MIKHLEKTTTKFKSQKNVWNEDFTTEVHNGQNLNLTVFHDAAIPPDEFVANCSIELPEMIGKSATDIWVCEKQFTTSMLNVCLSRFSIEEKFRILQVDLEPHGQIHLELELRGSLSEVILLRLIQKLHIPSFSFGHV